jgi:hypothetical protein
METSSNPVIHIADDRRSRSVKDVCESGDLNDDNDRKARCSGPPREWAEMGEALLSYAEIRRPM